jgi:hypothetical protein
MAIDELPAYFVRCAVQVVSGDISPALWEDVRKARKIVQYNHLPKGHTDQ